jgi:hemin uptake protein HemP
MEESSNLPPEPKPEAGSIPPLVRRSEDLFQGRTEVLIEHNGAVYKLRITAAGRLILTK